MKQISIVLGATATLGLVLFAVPLSGADQQKSPPAGTAAPPAWKTEIKLFVTPENVVQATTALKLDEHSAVEEIICFFDTSDGTLDTNNLILRARQQAGELGDSTVKVRLSAAAAELSEVEKAITPEQDWTNEAGPSLSRSLDRRGLADGLVRKVAEGRVAVEELFNDAQRKLVTTRLKGFRWESLRRYGLVEARVWHQQWKLEGFPEAVTVELWHLQQGSRAKDILEVSAKAKAETEEAAKILASQFFGAARGAGLGRPAGQTKTQMALDFFKPGR